MKERLRISFWETEEYIYMQVLEVPKNLVNKRTLGINLLIYRLEERDLTIRIRSVGSPQLPSDPQNRSYTVYVHGESVHRNFNIVNVRKDYLNNIVTVADLEAAVREFNKRQ